MALYRCSYYYFGFSVDTFKLPERQVSKPLRLCVVDVFKGMGSGFSVAGIIHAGAVQPGDRLLVMPQGEMLTVKGVDAGILACPMQSIHKVKKVD